MAHVGANSFGVSVIVPAHNDANYIGDCLASLLAQTHTPREILVCDDASEDDTLGLAERFRRRYPELIRVIRHDINIGCARNFNAGLQAATESHVSIIAADDYWYAEKLAREVACLRETGHAWAYSRIELVSEEGRDAGRKTPFWGTLDMFHGDLFRAIVERRVSPRNLLIGRKALEAIGWFDSTLGMYEDWDLKLRLAYRYPAACVEQVGGVYRQHNRGISRSNTDRQLREAGRVLRRNRHLIQARYGSKSNNVIADAYLKLMPDEAAHSDASAPAWLRWPCLPNRLDRLGTGVWFCYGLAPDQQIQLRQALRHHPDIAVWERQTSGGTSAVLKAMIARLPSNVGLPGLSVLRELMYQAYRSTLCGDGRSLVIDVETPRLVDPARLRTWFPGANLIVVQDPAETGAAHQILDCPPWNADGRLHGIVSSAVDDAFLAALVQTIYAAGVEAGTGCVSATPSAGAEQLNREGEACFVTGDLEAASRLFLDALALDPGCSGALNNLGVVAWRRGQAVDAVRWLRRGLAVDPVNPELNRNLGQILVELGRPAEARDLLSVLLRHRPHDTELRAQLDATQAVRAGARNGSACKSGVPT